MSDLKVWWLEEHQRLPNTNCLMYPLIIFKWDKDGLWAGADASLSKEWLSYFINSKNEELEYIKKYQSLSILVSAGLTPDWNTVRIYTDHEEGLLGPAINLRVFTKNDTVCICSNRDIMMYGCPSCHNKKCRSRK